MKTKALLLTVALGAAGAATSMAQVYSQNAVGYINISVQKGFNLVANQLVTSPSTLNALLPAPTPGTTIYKLVNGIYVTKQFDPDDLAWLPDGNLTVGPGEGFFVFNPSTTFTWTLVGEVPQGTLNTPLPHGFAGISSQVPQQGTLTALGLVGQPGFTIYRWVNNGSGGGAYATAQFDPDDLAWLPSEPSLSVGEGALFFNPNAAASWTRTFTVN